MANFASSATTGGARKHAWTKTKTGYGPTNALYTRSTVKQYILNACTSVNTQHCLELGRVKVMSSF